MTLRHIVVWKLNGATKQERADQAKEASALLLSLKDKIDVVQDIQVHHNELNEDKNADLILISDFADATALATYAAHPEHLPAIELMQRISLTRSAIDFTL